MLLGCARFDNLAAGVWLGFDSYVAIFSDMEIGADADRQSDIESKIRSDAIGVDACVDKDFDAALDSLDAQAERDAVG